MLLCYFVILAIEAELFLQSSSLNLSDKPLQSLNNYNLHDETIKGIIELFKLEVKAAGRNGKLYLQNLLSLLANHYLLNYSNYTDLAESRQLNSRLDERQIARVDDYIASHLGESVTIDDLAELLGCSKFYFLREFKKLQGVTPYQYLMSRRLVESKQRLTQTAQSISAIAAALGFNDQSHFTRAFKKEYGLTPGQWRKQ